MRRAHLALPLALVTLLACQATDDPSTSGDPVSPASPAPSFGAAVLQIPTNYFLIFDDERGYTATTGLVSPPGDLAACGGSGPEVYDGGGIERIVETPAGSFHVRDDLHQATIVFYEGATPDVCELATHPVLGRGRGNLHWTVKALVNGSTSIQATFGGILELTAGGRAQMLGVGHVVFDQFGNVTVHEDHFRVKPIGK
jgi:hypothetical protein